MEATLHEGLVTGSVVTVGECSVPATVAKLDDEWAEITWFDPLGTLHRERVKTEKLRVVYGNPRRQLDREPILQFFRFIHLPERLQVVSRPFGELAERVLWLPRNAERSAALRKLLEAKDAAVRSVLFKDGDTGE